MHASGILGREIVDARHCERQRSNPVEDDKILDCFVASLLAMTVGPEKVMHFTLSSSAKADDPVFQRQS